MPAVPIRFSFADFRGELNTLKSIGRNFLDRNALFTLDSLVHQLDQIQLDRGNRTISFEIPEDNPLRTKVSMDFEGSNRRAPAVVGTISWKWNVRPVGDGRRNPLEFEVSGLASTKLRILDAETEDEAELAMWRVELGDYQSPGCYFHTQVLGESESSPFPHRLCVPRLPTLFATPMAAVEYLIGELFQDKWEQHAAGDRDDVRYWNSIQKKRLKELLSWKLERIENCQGSPWVAMKRAKPSEADELFMGKKG